MIGPLERAVQVAAERIAVRCGDLALTYAQTWDRCRRLVGALRGLGVGEGDRVAVAGPHCHRCLELSQAVPGAGMVLVPLNQRHSADALAAALRDVGAKALFVGPGIELPAGVVEYAIGLDEGYEELIADAAPADFPTDLAPDALAGLFAADGADGAAPGVMLTHRNLLAGALSLQASWPFTAETRWLAALPPFDAGGSVAGLATVWNAGEHVVLPSFAPGAALDLVQAHGVTATLLAPSMLAALSEEQLARPRAVDGLRRIGHGGEPIAADALHRVRRAFPAAELLHVYGPTETASIATLLAHEERLLDAPQARSCGQPAVGVEVAVLAPDGGRAGAGQVGEVVVRGENVMAGYWNRPEQTAAALVDGWFRTGDLGYQDEHAFLYLVDRAGDMIASADDRMVAGG